MENNQNHWYSRCKFLSSVLGESITLTQDSINLEGDKFVIATQIYPRTDLKPTPTGKILYDAFIYYKQKTKPEQQELKVKL